MHASVPQLTTPRLVLRPYRADEAFLLHRLVSDPEVFFWLDHPVDRTATDTRFAKLTGLYERRLGWWAVFRKSGDRRDPESSSFVGQVILQPLPGSEEIEIGYHFVTDARGHGFATESASCLIRYGFETLGLQRIVAIVLPTNAPSLRVVARLGMRMNGDLMHAGLMHRLFETTCDAFTAAPAGGPHRGSEEE